MNTELMFSSKTDLWETPQELFDELNQEFHFTLDVCATPQNAKCEKYYTKEQNGLCQPWEGTIWCNPPYGRQVKEWVCRSLLTSQTGNTVVMLLPARTDTKWFHEYIYNRSNVEIRFLNGRLKFGDSKNSAPFPSMIVIFYGESKTEKKYISTEVLQNFLSGVRKRLPKDCKDFFTRDEMLLNFQQYISLLSHNVGAIQLSNYDRIKDFSVDEMVNFLERFEMGDIDYSQTFCNLCAKDAALERRSTECLECLKRWLLNDSKLPQGLDW